MSLSEIIYDPIEAQLEDLRSIEKGTSKLTDYTSPQVAQLLLRQYSYNLLELKKSKNEITELTNKIDSIKEERESLRIKLASKKERLVLSWIDIPVSFLGGFAINIITDNPKNFLGWSLLILTIIILLCMRLPDLPELLQNLKKEED